MNPTEPNQVLYQLSYTGTCWPLAFRQRFSNLLRAKREGMCIHV